MDEGALADFIAAFRLSIERSENPPADGSDHQSEVDWTALVSRSLLQLKPATFELLEEDRLLPDQQSEEHILRPYPSLHSCFVCNVVAAVSVLTEGRDSRFVRRGSIPPVYLSCTMNYVLNDDDGCAIDSGSAPSLRIETYEPAIASQQEMCVEEAKTCAEVKWCLHPGFRCDWLGYFKHYFVLQQFFELWKGDDFVGTSDCRPHDKHLECFLCHSLHRSALTKFESDSTIFSSFGGCVVVFRDLVPNSQLFGVWFLWLRVNGSLLIVDLQNSNASRSLQAAVAALGWDSPPMTDVFFAPFKRDLFSLIDRKLPKNRRSVRPEADVIKRKTAKRD